MKCRLFLVSESAVIDQNSNNLSVFNMLEQLNAQGFPVIVPRLTVVIALDREEGDEETASLAFWIKQNKSKILEQQIEVDFQGKPRVRQLVNLIGFVITEPGSLVFRLNRDKRKFAEYRIDVVVLPGPSKIDSQ